MKLLDRAIRAVAPLAALKREHARIALEALDALDRARSYDAAASGRRTGGWRAPDNSAVAAIRGSLSRLRSRSRELGRNSAWAPKAVRIITTAVIGGQGILPEPVTEKDSEFREVLSAWEEWANCNACDASGQMDFAGLQRLVISNVVESGEVLVRMRPRRASDGLPVPLQLQVLEADHLDEELDTITATPGENRIIQGVEYDGLDRRVAYHLHKSHPGDTLFGNWERVRVPAESVAHCYRIDRPGQVRGVPWGAPALLRVRAWANAMDSELERLVIASSFVGFVHDVNGSTAEQSPLGEVLPGVQNPAVGSTQQFEPGTFKYLEPGKSITFGKPEAFENLPGYGKLTLREIAAAYGVTYEDLAGDLEGVNFSSGRLGRILFNLDVATWQRDIVIVPFLARVWAWWSVQALLAGRVKRILPVTWQVPGRQFLDPKEEGAAITNEVQAGLQSLSAAIRSLGRNPDAVLRQLQKDKKLAEELGLSLTVFADVAQRPGQAQAGSAKPEAKPAAKPAA